MAGTVGKHSEDVRYYYQLSSPKLFLSINSYCIIVKLYLYTDLPALLDSHSSKRGTRFYSSLVHYSKLYCKRWPTPHHSSQQWSQCPLPFKCSGPLKLSHPVHKAEGLLDFWGEVIKGGMDSALVSRILALEPSATMLVVQFPKGIINETMWRRHKSRPSDSRKRDVILRTSHQSPAAWALAIPGTTTMWL